MKIELQWIEECPSSQSAREFLEEVLREEKIDALIELIQIRNAAEGVAQKFLGSPTIRINGVDPFAEPNQKNFGLQCRIYRPCEGLKGMPTKEMLREALTMQNFPFSAEDKS